MKINNRNFSYDVNLNEKDIDIIVDCIRKAKFSNFRKASHAQSLLELFLEASLTDNKTEYVNKYLDIVGTYLKHKHSISDDEVVLKLDELRLKIKDDFYYVFGKDCEYWADWLVSSNVICNEFLEKSYMESIVNQDDCVNSEVNYRQQMIDSVIRPIKQESKLKVKARIDKAQGLLRKLRGK